MRTQAFLISLCLVAFVACSTPRYDQARGSRVDVSVADPSISSSGFAANEVVEIVGYIMPRMMQSPFLNQAIAKGEADVTKVPKIVVLPVKNNTRFTLNKNVFMRRLRSELNKKAVGKIFFLARERLAELIAERKLRGEEGVTTADFFLTGTIDGMDAAGVRGGSQETYFYAFQLIDTKTDMIIWEDNYEISKITMERLMNR